MYKNDLQKAAIETYYRNICSTGGGGGGGPLLENAYLFEVYGSPEK